MKLFWQTLLMTVFIVSFTIVCTEKAQAGNPLYMAADNTPLIWDTTQTIKYKVDPKGLGKLSYSESVALVQIALSVWENVADVNIKFEYLGPLNEALNADNWESVASNNIYAEAQDTTNMTATQSQQQHYVVIGFDNTGEIMTAKGSANATGVQSITGVLGTYEDPQFITSAHVFINGLYYNGTDNDAVDLNLVDLLAIVIHELGHTLGLDHTLFNYDIYQDILSGSIDSSNARFLPTMFPRFVQSTGEHIVSLHPDDIATLQWLYGDGATGTISGEISDAGGSPVETMLVTVRNTASPLCEAYSQSTSILCSDLNTSPSGDGQAYFNASYCLDGYQLGTYQIPLLENGSYTIDVQEIPEQFSSSIARFDYSVREIPGGAEFYNTLDEANEDTFAITPVNFMQYNLYNKDIVLASTVSGYGDAERVGYAYFETDPLFETTETNDTYCPETGDITEDMIAETLSQANFAISSDLQEDTQTPIGGCSLRPLNKTHKTQSLSFLCITLFALVCLSTSRLVKSL